MCCRHDVNLYTYLTGVRWEYDCPDDDIKGCILIWLEKSALCTTRQVTRATHARNRVCPRVELILKIIIILLIIFLGFIKSK